MPIPIGAHEAVSTGITLIIGKEKGVKNIEVDTRANASPPTYDSEIKEKNVTLVVGQV
jgi:hypothetical protein